MISKSNIANSITFFRIGLIPVIVSLYFVHSEHALWLAVILFFIGCVSDYFDGYVARTFGRVTRFGKLIDPIADKLLIASVLMMLSGFGYIAGLSLLPAIIIVCREIFVSGLREWLGLEQVELPVSSLSKWKTFVQMLSLGMIMLWHMPFYGPLLHQSGLLMLWFSALLSLITAFSYVQKTMDE